MSKADFKKLKVAIIGGGLGGLSAAIALRRAGHLGTTSTISLVRNTTELDLQSKSLKDVVLTSRSVRRFPAPLTVNNCRTKVPLRH